MATFKNAIKSPVGTTPVTIYTATGVKSIFVELDVTNISGSTVTVDVTIRDASEAVTAYISKGVSVAANGTLAAVSDGRKIVLEPGDYIQVVSSAVGSVCVVGSLLEDVI